MRAMAKSYQTVQSGHLFLLVRGTIKMNLKMSAVCETGGKYRRIRIATFLHPYTTMTGLFALAQVVFLVCYFVTKMYMKTLHCGLMCVSFQNFLGSSEIYLEELYFIVNRYLAKYTIFWDKSLPTRPMECAQPFGI